MSEVELPEIVSEVGVVAAATARKEKESDVLCLRQELHDLSQPLTALECLLYINREPVGGEPLEAAALRNVMAEALVECGRMTVLVRKMQERTLERGEH